jgi:hypothetical protein
MAGRLRRAAAPVLTAGALLAASRTDAACLRPGAEALARWLAPPPAPPTHVRVQLLPFAAPLGLRWAAVSWGDPPDGAVVVLDCAGRPVAAEPVGPILYIRPGPAVAGQPTLVAVYRRSGDASLRDQSVALLRYAAPGLAVVWRHEISDVSEDASRPGRGIALTWRWRFSPDARVIRLTGERATGELSDLRRGSAASAPRRLRPQAFCWIPGRRRFDRCAP